MARKKKDNREKKKRLHPVLRIVRDILILAIILGMAGAFAYFFCGLESVSVSGTGLYTDEEIEGYILDDPYCVNTVYVFIKNKLLPKKSAEFIESFDVKMTGLNSIEISAKEKTILGYMTNDNLIFIYFNYDGDITEISDTYVDGYMRVQGVVCDNPKIGDQLSIGEAQVGYLTSLIKLLQKNELMPQVISYDEYSRIRLDYESFNISLGNSEYLEDKITRVTHILPQIEGMNGTLHLENYTPQNTDIVFEKED